MIPLRNPKPRIASLLALAVLAAPAAMAGSEVVFEKTWRIEGSRLDQDALVDAGAFTVGDHYLSATLAIGCSPGASGHVEIARASAPGATAWVMECVNAIVPTGETGVLYDTNPRSIRAGGVLSLQPGDYAYAFQGAGFGDVAVRIVGTTA